MGRHSETILKINTPKTNTEEKRRKRTIRWGIKSCLSILLAATVTTTTIYSQVLYAQAEAGEAPDGKISFTFQPLEKTEYELDTKGSIEDTLSLLYEQGLPKVLTVTTQPEAEVPDLVNPDVSGNMPDTDVTDIDLSENVPDPDMTDTDFTENTSDTDVTDTDPSENTDGSDVKDLENTSGSGAEGTDSSENTDGSDAKDWEGSTDSDVVNTDSHESSTTVLSVTVPDTPVNSAPEEVPVEIMTSENNADSDVSDNASGDNPTPDEPDAPSASQ